MSFTDEISIAALLHDIGKFYQRTGIELSNESNYDYCPHQGKTHRHAAYTAQFFDDFEKEFKIFGSVKDNGQGDVSDANIVDISSSHHKPSTKYESIVAEADRIASGLDKKEFEDYNQPAEEELKYYKNARLLSIFSRIYVGDKDFDPEERFYKLSELNEESIFPKKLKDLEQTADNLTEDYKNLWDSFINDFKIIKFDASLSNFNGFYQALSYLLEKYCGLMPSSSSPANSDVSLFDHLKTTSSISVALYLYHKNKNDFSKIEDREEQKYIMLQGDFSGIQKFIFDKYGESNKFSAKILRAKSFFVASFTELAASYVCEKFNSNIASIVINTGGKFNLLLPNIDQSETSTKIKEIKEGINKIMYNLTYSQTIFNLGKITLCGNDFQFGRFSKKMKELAGNLEKDKLKPIVKDFVFTDYLPKMSNAINNGMGVCCISGIHPADTQFYPYGATEDKIYISTFIKRMIEIGEKIVDEDFPFLILHSLKFKSIVESNQTQEYLKWINNVEFIGFKKDTAIESGDIAYDITGGRNKFCGAAKKPFNSYVPVFDEADENSPRYYDIDEKERNKDIKQGNIKLFNYIARDGRIEGDNGKFIGVSHIAALKGDVDNAGEIFINGFKRSMDSSKDSNDVYTLSRYTMLSRMFDYFFGVWLTVTVRNRFGSVYTVFAGGEDLFLIGPWNQIINLADVISKSLKEFAGFNKKVHISIGISIAGASVPIYQLADTAEEELEKAKEFERKANAEHHVCEKKNAVSVFGQTLNWEDFYDVFKNKDYFGALYKSENGDNESISMSTVFIYKVLKFIEMNEVISPLNISKGVSFDEIRKNARWRALFGYHAYRNYKKDAAMLDKVNLIPKMIQTYGKRLIIPITYIIYERRG